MKAPTRKPRNPQKTRIDLISAAMDEFSEIGFDRTNTNAIAKRANFAPQTFYRHFADKLSIFLEVYKTWVEEEVEALGLAKDATTAARILVKHHGKSRLFRLSLRTLTVTDPMVREARARSRLEQISRFTQQSKKFGAKQRPEQITILLFIERLADAIVEDELSDMQVTKKDQMALLTNLLREELGLK